MVAMLGAVLFQACDHAIAKHVDRAEKILTIMTLPEVLLCIKKLSR